MCLCLCVCVCVCVCVKCVHVATPHVPSPHGHTYIQAMHEREQRRGFKHALKEVCLRVCECESELVCACCIHVCVFMFIHVCTYMYVCTYMCVHTFIQYFESLCKCHRYVNMCGLSAPAAA